MTTPDQGLTWPNPLHFGRRPEPHASKGLPVTSDDLVPRILAAIEETEQEAQDAKNGRSGVWRHVVTPGLQNKVVDDLDYTVTGHYHDDSAPWWTCPHIARHDPDAVLRRCAADRRLLELHEQVPTHEGSTETGCKLCLWEYSWGCDVQAGICETVQIVAEGYGVAPATEPADQQETT